MQSVRTCPWMCLWFVSVLFFELFMCCLCIGNVLLIFCLCDVYGLVMFSVFIAQVLPVYCVCNVYVCVYVFVYMFEYVLCMGRVCIAYGLRVLCL